MSAPVQVRSCLLLMKIHPIIDAHEDLAWNMLTFQRDYLLPAAETRRREAGQFIESVNGQTLLGWEDYQRGQVAVVFGTLFLAPRRFASAESETQFYTDAPTFKRLSFAQIDAYRRLCGDHPDAFRLITSRAHLEQVWQTWKAVPARLPDATPQEGIEPVSRVTHPVGLLLLLEGAEGLAAPEEILEWWEAGVRMVGVVWAGGHFCGGTMEPGGFTGAGYELLEIMAERGFVLDISHMNEKSTQQALDRYPGAVAASHANARALLHNPPNERHLSDAVIRRLIERGGVMGVIPYNRFLNPSWQPSDDRRLITLETLAAHIDHICQMAGNANHAAIGTDFDGGFGYPSVPLEIDTIADLQKLDGLLERKGYQAEEIGGILGGNWYRFMQAALPERG
ncbi:MAG TPA: membrane dipeptidase [Anaerolineaceae bacterium]